MPALSAVQYNAVDNIFSMTVATMGAAALFFMARCTSIRNTGRPCRVGHRGQDVTERVR
jgi:hypothetical protein